MTIPDQQKTDEELGREWMALRIDKIPEEIGKLLRVLDTYQYLAETRMGYEDMYNAAQRKLDAMEEPCEPQS